MKKEIKRNLNYYNKYAESWVNRAKDPFSLEKQFIKFCNYFKKGEKVIDIGCAAGIHVPMFLGLGRKLQYEGLDISKELISIAKRRYPQLKFHIANLVDTKSLPTQKYAGFWAVAVLMHIPEEDWNKMLYNISKICKPKAIGFILVPKKRPVTKSKKDNRFFTYWDKQKLGKVLHKVNWKIIQSGKRHTTNLGDWSWHIVRLP